ncbi:MAG: TAXI family TRAP transporter solute-binding subunit [Sedimenticola sp.]
MNKSLRIALPLPVLVLTLLLTALTSANAADQTNILIGTGGKTGVYYAVSNSICRLVNAELSRKGIRCSHQEGGSVKNINEIHSGKVDVAIAQSDWQSHAYKGTDKQTFPDAPYTELRSLFSVHPESFTLVASKRSGIERFQDLTGKRVNVGNPGSGQRATMEVMMRYFDLKMDDFSRVMELPASEQAIALCTGKIDAFVYTVGHPSSAIKEATLYCESRIVPVTGDPVDRLVSDHSFYSFTTIPGKLYKGNPKDIATFGLAATVVVSEEMDADLAYQIVKAVFTNFNRFKRRHPAFRNLDPRQMIRDNLTAPLHEGALRFYKEQGWL